jgi:hypothetical protein
MMTFRHIHLVDANPPGRRILIASSRSSLKPFSHFNGRSRFNFSSKARVLFGAVGVFAGMSFCSSPALAKAEEETRQEVNNSGDSIRILSNDIPNNNFPIDTYVDEYLARYLSTLDSSHNDADHVHRDAETYTDSHPPTYTGSHPAFPSSTNPHGFDDPFIPETVWSLDASSGAHVGHISGEPGSDIYAVFGGSPEINEFWTRAISGPEVYNYTGKASSLLFVSIKFQVASCGGSSAEHSDLDYCDKVQLSAGQSSDSSLKSKEGNSNTATQNPSNDVLSSNGALTPDFSAQPTTAPLTRAIVDQSQLQETLSVLGPCDVSASCANLLIDPLERPVDAPADDSPPLIDDLVPSINLPFPQTPALSLPYPEIPAPSPIIYVDSSLPPIATLQPLNPIPEASTWVMTIVGFSIMAFMFGRKRRPCINPISIVDGSDFKKY